VTLNEQTKSALDHDLVVDITTTGRRTGEPRTLEIWFHRIAGRYYITGWPGVRGWYANLLDNPRFTVHLKQSATESFEAIARPVTDEVERREILRATFNVEGGTAQGDFESWVTSSPIIEFTPES
jgi:deazaflavin-dependent oxidoreductase (nitroreductase family)